MSIKDTSHSSFNWQTENIEGSDVGARPKPYTLAPNDFSVRASHEPLNPVIPVIRTLESLNFLWSIKMTIPIHHILVHKRESRENLKGS